MRETNSTECTKTKADFFEELEQFDRERERTSKKKKEDTKGTSTKDDPFGELKGLDLEKEALANNNNQDEKIIFMKETDNTECTTTKAV